MRILALLLMLAIGVPVRAQTPPSPTYQNVTILGTLNGGILTIAPYQLTALGHQIFTSSDLATVKSLTVPTNATVADIEPEGTPGTNNMCVRYFDDGTVPTGSIGFGLAPQQLLLGYSTKPLSGAALSSLKLIQASGATCSLTINYYK